MRSVRSVLLWGGLLICGTAPAEAQGRLPQVTPGARATVLVFVASHCPCTDAHRQHVQRLIETAAGQGVRFYVVFANGGETPDRIAHFMRAIGWPAVPIHDRDGRIMAALGAKTTPHAFLLNGHGAVVYDGAVDDSVQNMGQIVHPYLRTALEQLLAGRAVTTPHTPPYGCAIVRGGRVG